MASFAPYNIQQQQQQWQWQQQQQQQQQETAVQAMAAMNGCCPSEGALPASVEEMSQRRSTTPVAPLERDSSTQHQQEQQQQQYPIKQQPLPQQQQQRQRTLQPKRIAQMERETLEEPFRSSRLKRLVEAINSTECLPDCNYINTVQGGRMQKSWRRKVAEWLLEFVDEFGLPNDIVAAAIYYLDMFLSRRPVDKGNLQLLAMVCIFVASKFHEVDPISISELQTLAEGGYSEQQIRALEIELLRILEWNMNPTTTHSIMRHVANFVDANVRWALLEHAEGYCDYSLTDYEFLSRNRASVAVAAVLCSLVNIGRPQDIQPVMFQMRRLGVVTESQESEIAAIRLKLLEVFYKNFPHLRPDMANAVGRSNSPTSVSGVFAQSRCASPAPPPMKAGISGQALPATRCQVDTKHSHCPQSQAFQLHQAPFGTASAFGAAH